MDVMLMPADRSGCGLYRMMIPGREVAKIGAHRVYYANGVTGKIDRVDGMPVVTYLPPLNADVLVLQRPFDSVVAQVVPLAQKQGVAVVVELDDDVRRVDPGNIAHHRVQPKLSPLSNWRNVVTACAQADWVTISTPALRSYAPHGRVSVVPNAVPSSVLSVPYRKAYDPVVVGWSGAVATHPRDLQACGRGVLKALRATGAAFAVVGAGEGVQGALHLDHEPYATGWLDLPDYPETLRATLDVGIVPLADTPFNRSKSYLKGLEMAALGIPFVASPLPEYRKIASMGIGEIASTPTEWEHALRRLITDEPYRLQRAAEGREAVARSCTISHTAPQWSAAWEAARAYRDTQRLVAVS